MKRFLFLLIVTVQSLFWSGQAAAAPCASSSLATYVGLAGSGCTIGGLNFSGFTILPSATNAIRSSAITVTPIVVGATVVGVRFGVSPTASGGNYFDDLITYRVTGLSTNLTGATVDFAGSSQTGDAAVSVSAQLCLAGTFTGADGVSGCSTGSTLNLAVIDVGFGPDPAYSLAFGPVGFLSVVSELAFDSGSGFVPESSSTLTSGTNLFSFVAVRAVPEPSGGLLIALGALGLALTRRRRS